MLSEILKVCQSAPQGVSIEEIAHTLNKPPSVIEGMVHYLLRMGKLIRYTSETICQMCPTRSSCILLESSEGLYSIPLSTAQEYNHNSEQYPGPDRGSELKIS